MIVGAPHGKFTGRDEYHFEADRARRRNVDAEFFSPGLLIGLGLGGVKRRSRRRRITDNKEKGEARTLQDADWTVQRTSCRMF